MNDRRHAWFATPNVGWFGVLLATLIWGGALLAVFRSEVGEYLDARLAQPTNFRLRDALGKSPVVSPKLKIYSIDDSTLSKIDSWVLSIDDWATVLQTLDANHPRAIVIDAMFGKADGVGGDFKDALAKISGVKAPVIIGSFNSASPISNRDPLDLERPEFRLSAMLGANASGDGSNANLPPMMDRSSWHVYGATPGFAKAVRYIGSINYTGAGLVDGLIRLGSDRIITHMSLNAAKERHFEGGKLVLDGSVVPIDRAGRINVNWVPPSDEFRRHVFSMGGLIVNSRAGKPSKLVNEDDIVLILPMMFTGNADFKSTPFGMLPGGYVHISMLNSLLTGDWLKPLEGGEGLIFLLAFLGALIGMKLGVISFWVTLLALGATSVGASIYLFAYHGIVVPWLFPTAGFFGTAISVFAEKTRKGEKKVRAIRAALEGSVAPEELKHILKKPERISFEARERVVTLMFIDVVGFSLLAENMLPRMAFDNLKKMLATIGDAIHAGGGIIDKTLGDGLLCYFGYRFDVDSSSPDHAEQALRCAVKIQRDNLMRNIEAAENGEPVYPLRIGINTASCYLGDLGSANRIDFTVVGNGVNFAKRLEGACDMHSVLIGATTNDLVKGIGLPSLGFTKRFIRIKHHSELVEAYEYDPFHSEPDLRMAALEGFRKCANIERVDQRWPVHDPSKIQLHCDFGEGQLVNFSHSGLSIKLPQLLAKGTRLNVTLDAANGALRALLTKDGIDILQGEVRWGYVEGAEFVHGFMITNVNEVQSDAIVQYLCEFCFTRDAKREGGQANDANDTKPKAS